MLNQVRKQEAAVAVLCFSGGGGGLGEENFGISQKKSRKALPDARDALNERALGTGGAGDNAPGIVPTLCSFFGVKDKAAIISGSSGKFRLVAIIYCSDFRSHGAESRGDYLKGPWPWMTVAELWVLFCPTFRAKSSGPFFSQL